MALFNLDDHRFISTKSTSISWWLFAVNLETDRVWWVPKVPLWHVFYCPSAKCLDSFNDTSCLTFLRTIFSDQTVFLNSSSPCFHFSWVTLWIWPKYSCHSLNTSLHTNFLHHSIAQMTSIPIPKGSLFLFENLWLTYLLSSFWLVVWSSELTLELLSNLCLDYSSTFLIYFPELVHIPPECSYSRLRTTWSGLVWCLLLHHLGIKCIWDDEISVEKMLLPDRLYG